MVIYKKDSKWKVRYIDIMFSDIGELIQVSWIVWTTNPITAVKICKPKNIWKSNETTSPQQAAIEATAMIKDKLTKGYFSSIEELLSSDDVLLPMLAKDFTKEKNKIDWSNCYVQPKLDWMRALVKIKDGAVSIISRQWKEITTVPHIIQSFIKCAKENKLKDNIFDWELYAHWFTFQENMEMVKKFSLWITDKYIKFHMYDIVSDKSFRDRLLLEQVTMGLPDCVNYPDNNIEFVTTFKISSIEWLKIRHLENLDNWYEGSIVRWGNDGYKANWRSSNLLKYKDFLDITATIVDVIPSDARPLQWVLVCELPTWEKFKSNLKFSHKEREEILANKDKYIWQTAEIRFFEYTDWGLPRFPVCVWFRLDK